MLTVVVSVQHLVDAAVVPKMSALTLACLLVMPFWKQSSLRKDANLLTLRMRVVPLL